MDEDSILFQAMKSEMMPPAIDTISMRMTDPNNPYPIGVETRTKSPGGPLSNPLRMQQQPTDFAGRPWKANDNPAKMGGDNPYGFNRTEMRPTGNVINQYRDKWQQQQIGNEVNRAAEEALKAPLPPMPPRGIMQRIKDFYSNNHGSWWLD